MFCIKGTIYWEQRKLGEMYTQLVERNIELLPFKKILSASTMNYKVDGSGAAEESLSNYKRLRVGDIAFEGHTSRDFRYGRFVLNDTGDGILSPRFSALRPIRCMPIKFWKYYIHYEPIMKKILVNSTKSGTMMNELVVEEFLKEVLLVPEENEQQKIGGFFNGLDHLITLHQSKYFRHILKAITSCTLYWEQRKFSELYELVNEKNDGSYGKDSNITVATMQFKSNIQISKNEYLNTYNIFKKGYIAFEGHKSKEFRFGRFVENDIGDGIVSHIFIVFRPIMEFDINFWKYAINNELIMQSILSRSTKASTMMNDLVVKDFLKEIFFVPFLGEQACIGKTLKSLDHLITLHQSKLEKLQKIKKSMLESMFV